MKVTQPCPTLCDSMDYTLHGILQARILEWVAFPFSRGSSQPRDQAQFSCIAGGPPLEGRHYLHYFHHSLASGQITGRKQPPPSTENWIKDLLTMAQPIRTRPSFPLSQSLPSGSFHKSLILLYQRADRHNHRKLTNLITWTTALSNSMKLRAMPYRAIISTTVGKNPLEEME